MSAHRPIKLVNDMARAAAVMAVSRAPDGHVCKIEPPKRSLNQNAAFHALCDDVAKSGFEWGGCRRTAEEIKVLLVSAHAMATRRESEVVEGFEGEPVQLRESTAQMSKERLSSLLEYSIAFCATHGIALRTDRDDAR